jgi:hypothetical protein
MDGLQFASRFQRCTSFSAWLCFEPLRSLLLFQVSYNITANVLNRRVVEKMRESDSRRRLMSLAAAAAAAASASAFALTLLLRLSGLLRHRPPANLSVLVS